MAPRTVRGSPVGAAPGKTIIMSITSKHWVETRAVLERMLDALRGTAGDIVLAYCREGSDHHLQIRKVLLSGEGSAGVLLDDDLGQAHVVPLHLDTGGYGQPWGRSLEIVEALIPLPPTHPLRDAQDGRPGRGIGGPS